MTYDSIIFLNNAAVSLMESEQYRESVLTFQDAMYAKRFLYSTAVTGRQMSNNDIENAKIIPAIIHGAAKRLCSSIQKKPTKSSRFPLEKRLITLNFMDDDCFAKLLVYKSFLDQIDVVFRIDHESDNDEYNTSDISRNWELNSAILLYNYALACKIASQDPRRSNEYNCQLLEESMTFFQFAYDVVIVELEIFS